MKTYKNIKQLIILSLLILIPVINFAQNGQRLNNINEQRSIPNVDTNFIQFSGLSPNYPGLWQINLRIPMATAPGGPAVVQIYLDSFASNDINQTGYRTVLYIGN